MAARHYPSLPDPYAQVSAAELARIVASHDRLQAWNDQNEQALAAGGETPDAQVVSNIQSTAALIAQSGKSLSSQNHELMRALNLYDRTLQPVEVAKGFIEGSWHTLATKAEEALAFTQPGDMSLHRADARAKAVLDKPEQFASAVRQHMDPEALHQTLQANLTEVRQHLAQNMTASNSSRAVGNVLGATFTGVVIENANPGGKTGSLTKATEQAAAATSMKIDWHIYATLLGNGTQPPPLKPMRDFSEWMKYEPPLPNSQTAHVSYSPGKTHQIYADVKPDEGMRFLIEAGDDRDKYGSGTEAFLSAVKVLHENGNDIPQINANWSPGRIGTNWLQFMHCHLSGDSLERASKRTFTGRMAERLGLTSVDVSQVEWALETNHRELQPVFKRPEWGPDQAWNDYANAWVLSAGRPSLEVTPRVNPGPQPKPRYPIPPQLLQAAYQLPEDQREVVLQRLMENYDIRPIIEQLIDDPETGR